MNIVRRQLISMCGFFIPNCLFFIQNFPTLSSHLLWHPWQSGHTRLPGTSLPEQPRVASEPAHVLVPCLMLVNRGASLTLDKTSGQEGTCLASCTAQMHIPGFLTLNAAANITHLQWLWKKSPQVVWTLWRSTHSCYCPWQKLWAPSGLTFQDSWESWTKSVASSSCPELLLPCWFAQQATNYGLFASLRKPLCVSVGT